MIDAALTSSARTGTGNDAWQTPDVVLDRVRKVGGIGLDPCTVEDNPVGAARWCYIGAPLHYGQMPHGDGLALPWYAAVNAAELVYVNPPYSKMMPWAIKMAEEAACGTPIVALVAARTDTQWWRLLEMSADAVALWRGRLRFKGAPSSAPFPSALFAFNVGLRRFVEAFQDKASVFPVVAGGR